MPHPVIARLGLPLDQHGRIKVDPTLRVDGFDHVWALGDAAAVPDPAKKGQQPTPPTAQHAIRQGKLVGRNVAASIGAGKIKPFTFKTKGVFVDMGQGQAVATTLGIRWRGVPAWWLARSYHLAMLPGTKRKWRLLIDWNIQLLFGRDGSELGGMGRAPGLGVDPTGGGTPAGSENGGAPATTGATEPVAPS
jgi:NADH dehydrogenase